MNVLILSAAAKVLLVRAFAEAAHARGGQVFAADLTPDNAALFEADRAVMLPRSDAPEFDGVLAEFCAEHGVRLIVPTRDGELARLAAAKDRLAGEGVMALVPSPEALAICHDKRAFVAFCVEHGFGVPRTYAPGEQPKQFPVFVRPVAGAGGKGAGVIARAQDLPDDASLLVQDLETAPEWSVDVLLDLEGAPLQAVARRRIVVRDGEAVKSRVESAPILTEQALRLCGELGLVGHNVVQAFHVPGEDPRFIEINPRFGGASNLSIQAGLASPERILQMLDHQADTAAEPRDIREGLTLLRYPEDRIVTEDDLAALIR